MYDTVVMFDVLKLLEQLGLVSPPHVGEKENAKLPEEENATATLWKAAAFGRPGE